MILTSLTNSSITKIKQNKKPSQPQSTQKKRKKERLEGTSTTYENKVVGVHLIWGPDFYTGPLYIQRACPLYGKKSPNSPVNFSAACTTCKSDWWVPLSLSLSLFHFSWVVLLYFSLNSNIFVIFFFWEKVLSKSASY